MDSQKHILDGGRFVRQKQGKRVITIAYYEDNGVVHYGASVFRKTSTADQWSKESQREYALERLEKCPVTVGTPEFEHIGQLDDYVRECLFSYGCFK
jgi:hypothetical protein